MFQHDWIWGKALYFFESALKCEEVCNSNVAREKTKQMILASVIVGTSMLLPDRIEIVRPYLMPFKEGCYRKKFDSV